MNQVTKTRKAGGLSRASLPEIIDKANAGSIPHFIELGERMKQNFSLVMLDPILHHLRTANTPLSELTTIQANLAICTFVLFDGIKEWEFSGPSHKKAAAKKLLPALDSMCYWVDFAMSRLYHPDFRRSDAHTSEGKTRPAIHTEKEAVWCLRGARVFYSLCHLDESLRESAYASPRFLELILFWWVSTTTRDQLIIDDAPKLDAGHTTRTDPGTNLLYEAAEANSSGLAKAILQGKVCTPDSFVRMTFRRMHYFADGDNFALLPTCVETTDRLIRCNNRLLSAFIDAGAIPEYIEILVEVNSLLAQHLRSKKGDEESNRYQSIAMAHVFRQASWVLKWIELLPVAEVTPTIRHVISKGAIQMLGDIALMPRVQRQIQFNEQFPAFIGTLREYATFPRAVLHVQKAVQKCTSPIIDTVVSEWTRSDFILTDVMRKIDLCSQFLPQEKRLVICDNSTHNGLSSKGKTAAFKKAKTCSRCHSVVYCSRDCQTRDWSACHRFECCNMHREYLERKHKETFYSHGTRAFQVSVLVYFYETYMFSFLAARPKSGKAGQVVAVLSDLQHAPAGTTQLQPFADWISATGPLVPKHKRRRLFELTKRFSSQLKANESAGTGQLCLLHGIFGMNELDFNVVALLRHVRNTVPHHPGRLPSPQELEKASNFAKSDYQVEETLHFTTPYQKQDRGESGATQGTQNFANFFAMHGIPMPAAGDGSHLFT